MKIKLMITGLAVAGGVMTALAEVLIADPSILRDGGKYYLIGTQYPDVGIGGNVTGAEDPVFPILESTDLHSWRWTDTEAGKGRILRRENAFADKRFWAPQLLKHGGKYYFAYTADFHWGIAVADTLAGEFKPLAEFPRPGKGQQIDPFLFVDDDGKVYAYYSGRGIEGVELSSDLKKFIGDPVTCIVRDQDWEKLPLETCYEELNRKFGYKNWSAYRASEWVTEGPTVIKRGGKYVLFYSSNDFRSPDYCVGAAVAERPLGPWKKLQSAAVLSREHTGFNGTGHGDIFVGEDGALWYVFHAHHSGIKIDPRRTGVIRFKETFGADGFPRYEAEPDTMRLL